jgi:hypothetical protein
MFQKAYVPHTSQDISSNLHRAFTHNLYITSTTESSPTSVLCYDDVLCYLSNVIGHGSTDEIQVSLKRYFTCDQLTQASENLVNALQYTQSIVHVQHNNRLSAMIEQCLANSIDASSLLTTMQMIDTNDLLSSLPMFVTNDWLHMIRNIQDLEKIDSPSTSTSIQMINLQEQMRHLKEQLSTLHQSVDNICHLPLTTSMESFIVNEQCCLRTYCGHISQSRFMPVIDSPSSSSWSSLDFDKAPITTLNRTIPGFIRNPVSSFLMPTGSSTRNDMTSSMASIDDNLSSDDEQSLNSKTGSVVVIRDDDLWVYPIGVEMKSINYNPKEYHRSRSLFTSYNENHDRQSSFIRRKSFDDENFSRKNSHNLPAQMKKHKKGKGSLRNAR